MMTSSNVKFSLCEGIHKQTIEQTIEVPVIWDAMTLIMTSL